MATRVIQLEPQFYLQGVEIARKLGATKITLTCGNIMNFGSEWLMEIEGDNIPAGFNPTTLEIHQQQFDNGTFSESYSIGAGLAHVGGAN